MEFGASKIYKFTRTHAREDGDESTDDFFPLYFFFVVAILSPFPRHYKCVRLCSAISLNTLAGPSPVSPFSSFVCLWTEIAAGLEQNNSVTPAYYYDSTPLMWSPSSPKIINALASAQILLSVQAFTPPPPQISLVPVPVNLTIHPMPTAVRRARPSCLCVQNSRPCWPLPQDVQHPLRASQLQRPLGRSS